MKTKKTRNGPIQKWAQKVQWKRRVKAFCKPCWEIKYCPYGPLIEEFPFKSDPDEKSCRIFRHDCPVFYVAEPFTETKELRNISRAIPRPTQFRVLKRENQICSRCGKSVKDEYVEFDHIIPWSKGGSSDEHNIRLLCVDCNRKRGKKFEDEYLVSSFEEHRVEPIGVETAYWVMEWVKLSHELFKKENRCPTASEFCKFDGRRKVRDYDEATVRLITDIDEFFNAKRPTEIKQKVFKALKYRWGFLDREFHRLKETAEVFAIDVNELLSAEVSFINRLGWQVRLTEAAKKKWLRL